MRKIVNFFMMVFTLIAMYVTLWIFMFVISIPALPFLLGKSVNLTCNRAEINYVNCQQQRVHFYGLWSEPVTPASRVTSAVIKEYEIQDEDSTSTGYKLYLNTQNQSKELYDYISDYSKAYNDKQRIEDFISGRGDSYLKIVANKSFWGELGLIPMGFSYVVLGFMGIVFLISPINYVLRKLNR